ncbi:LLM class flavin-dependent oxidoreductase [Chitinophaga pendula]|uniref:MupA/Atu3671 family FMN-dependent luciferase-like monooxygenase n=1 Tax=Chitinophaga TaxID=79328 RepID=UPI000BAF9562|nr:MULTISPECIES: MupA/Atu3671 family FMN-dependent luciferase-like monooxygenase [Chitinophaga]ASZ13648.1 hypothetical protein CK934_23190 [Chitinophaga sp. MD30]UCJ08726.1 LLM class flavin-dependent oxidoreductase [Chitinophaga pendula]
MITKTLMDLLSAPHVDIQVTGNIIHVTGNSADLLPEIREQIQLQKQALLSHYQAAAGIATAGTEEAIVRFDIKDTITPAARHLDFSLFYFGNADAYDDVKEKYKLLIEGARFGDKNGFTAVWTPERHFNEFAGLYPSPAVAGAAIAASTSRIGIRAGSVVLPLHNPIRVAEEWSVIDNLSGGRAGIACASGWQANDFVLAPDHYTERHAVMYKHIEQIQHLWKGGAITLKDGNGQQKDTRIFPRPLQIQLPMWITSNGNLDTFRAAGRLGLNILTNFWGSSPDELGEKINVYRQARRQHGHSEGEGKVTLMLHTYVAPTREDAYEKTRTPLINYLRSSFGLFRHFVASNGNNPEIQRFSEQEIENMLDYSFYRYVSGSSLVGAPQDVEQVLIRFSSLGVDEIACLIDFGLEYEDIMKGLQRLTAVKDNYQAMVSTATQSAPSTDLPLEVAGF